MDPIKIKRPGALTNRAEANGNTVKQEIVQDLNSGTPLERKQAQFAKNAESWRHSDSIHTNQGNNWRHE